MPTLTIAIPTSATDSNILGMITGGEAKVSESITLQEVILCPTAVKFVKKDGASTPIRNRSQHNCSCVCYMRELYQVHTSTSIKLANLTEDC